MKIETLEKRGFRPVSLNTGKVQRQIIGSLLTTKDGRLYVSEVFLVSSAKSFTDFSYGAPKLLPKFRVLTRKGLTRIVNEETRDSFLTSEAMAVE